MYTKLIKFGVALCVLASVVACSTVKDERGLDERLAESGYRPGESIDRISSYRISDWTYLDDRHLIFSNGISEHYLVSLNRPCADLRGSQQLAFKTRTNILTRFDEVLVPSDGLPIRCGIEAISKVYRSQ
ncbi:MAG: DUF6491 family protein [Zhongshania sp.]|uniref:DUF6491 family protein n=1 Tax=Zhongshania sp. TaxID=1971902 RepID=UPI0026077954|nr:DUF6491 family protein [Zhongshania sp.]MDF1691841.1 DUF6491 family protein [Zhongshania sp.]